MNKCSPENTDTDIKDSACSIVLKWRLGAAQNDLLRDFYSTLRTYLARLSGSDKLLEI